MWNEFKNPYKIMAKHNEIGKIGEEIAKSFLVKHGFSIKAQNEAVRYGEIDIIVEKDSILHFIEVKSVEVKDFGKIQSLKIKPEDNMTIFKRFKLKRTINIYLSRFKEDKKVIIDLVCVYINMEIREGRVKFVENIEL